MAFDKGGAWIVVFRVPADDYKHRHLLRITGTGREDRARRDFLERHANVDAKIETFERMKSHDQLIDIAAQLMKEGGTDYRPLAEGEQHLTVAQVKRLRGEDEGKLTPQQELARVRGEILAAQQA